MHHEIELVVALGKGGERIAVDAALDHVFGYAVGLDMTRRDLQDEAKETRRPWEVSKAFESSAPMSELSAGVATSAIRRAGAIWLDVNGKRTQKRRPEPADLEGAGGDLLSVRAVPAGAGDLIMTGTPAGVGPVKRGDQLHGHIDGIGDLNVTVI